MAQKTREAVSNEAIEGIGAKQAEFLQFVVGKNTLGTLGRDDITASLMGKRRRMTNTRVNAAPDPKPPGADRDDFNLLIGDIDRLLTPQPEPITVLPTAAEQGGELAVEKYVILDNSYQEPVLVGV
jgi:hypothetical protein